MAAIGHSAAHDRSAARQLLGVVRAELGPRDVPPHSAAELALLDAGLAEPHALDASHESLRRAGERLGSEDPWNSDLRRRIAAMRAR